LSILVLVALLGAGGTWLGDWGDDGAGTGVAVMIAGGLMVIYLGASLESLTTRPAKEPRGFPVEPARQGRKNERQDAKTATEKAAE